MEAVSLDPVPTDLTRQCDYLGDFWLTSMKAGIEAGNLGHARQRFSCRLNRGKIVGLMQWRKWSQLLKLGENRRGDYDRTRKARSSMNHSMPNT